MCEYTQHEQLDTLPPDAHVECIHASCQYVKCRHAVYYMLRISSREERGLSVTVTADLALHLCTELTVKRGCGSFSKLS